MNIKNLFMYKWINQESNEDGTFKHIIKEGAHHHVLYYDSQGIHCSKPKCEINKT